MPSSVCEKLKGESPVLLLITLAFVRDHPCSHGFIGSLWRGGLFLRLLLGLQEAPRECFIEVVFDNA